MVDNAEFDAIYVEYKGQISRYCYLKLGSISMARELAEEAANDVFMTLYERWDDLDRGDKLRAWLYKTAQNTVLNKLRTERRRAPQAYVEDFAVQDSIDAMSGVDEYFASDLSVEKFAAHMKKRLDADDYELFSERFVKKRPYDKIAKARGEPYSTVRWRSLRIERIVRRELADFIREHSGG